MKTAKLQLMHTPGRKNSPQMRENITWDARTTAQSAHAAHSLTHAATCFMSSGSPFKHLDISYKNITLEILPDSDRYNADTCHSYVLKYDL